MWNADKKIKKHYLKKMMDKRCNVTNKEYVSCRKATLL